MELACPTCYTPLGPDPKSRCPDCGDEREILSADLVDFIDGAVARERALLEQADPGVLERLAVFNLLDRVADRDTETLVLADHLGVGPHSNVVDVGCGTGGFLRALQELGDPKRLGVDNSGLALAEGHRRLRNHGAIVLAHAEAERLPLTDGGCTHLFCLNALTYMCVPDAIREFARVVAPGGVLVVRTEQIWYDLSILSRPREMRLWAATVRDFPSGLVLAATGHQLRRSLWTGRRAFLSERTLGRLLRRFGFAVLQAQPYSEAPVFWGRPTQMTIAARNTGVSPPEGSGR